MAQFHHGVQTDIFERAAQKIAKISGEVKIQDFAPSHSTPKVLVTAGKLESAQNWPKFRVV